MKNYEQLENLPNGSIANMSEVPDSSDMQPQENLESLMRLLSFQSRMAQIETPDTQEV